MLKGIRHISGIKDWLPTQCARLVAAQIEDDGLAFRATGQRFGLSAPMVGRLYPRQSVPIASREHPV